MTAALLQAACLKVLSVHLQLLNTTELNSLKLFCCRAKCHWRYLQFWLRCVPGSKLPESWLQPKIVLLDVGMVTRLSSADQHNMVDLFQSLLGMDGQGIANAVLSFSGKPTCTMSRQMPTATALLTWHCWFTKHKMQLQLSF